MPDHSNNPIQPLYPQPPMPISQENPKPNEEAKENKTWLDSGFPPPSIKSFCVDLSIESNNLSYNKLGQILWEVVDYADHVAVSDQEAERMHIIREVIKHLLPPPPTWEEAQEAARQLAGPSAEIVHRYLESQKPREQRQ